MTMQFGFEEGFEEGDEPSQPGPGEQPTEEALTGHDQNSIVTVEITDTGDVVSVWLDKDWRNSVDPRGLHASVRDAANAATMGALNRQLEQVDMTGQSPAANSAPAQGAEFGETPITPEYAMRLVDAATVDLQRYLTQASDLAGPVTVTSGGGHVTVSGSMRRVSEVSIDEDWAGGARSTEIESELRDALTGFSVRSSPGESNPDFQSSAIRELTALVSDPDALIRRIRQAREG